MLVLFVTNRLHYTDRHATFYIRIIVVFWTLDNDPSLTIMLQAWLTTTAALTRPSRASEMRAMRYLWV